MRGKGCYPGISRRAKEQRPVLREYGGRDFPMFIFGLQLSSVPRLARWGKTGFCATIWLLCLMPA